MNHNLAFNFESVNPSWITCLDSALARMDTMYLTNLSQCRNWLPGPKQIFNAFSLPLENVNYILFGESPYPRAESANGYAFWDGAVTALWSETGMSKKVNRATSLRNIIKMLLIAENLLDKNHLQQQDIAKIDKTHLVQTNDELFQNFLRHGFLLLNATPVLQKTSKHQDAKAWLPFIEELLTCLFQRNPLVKLILWGQIATKIDKILPNLPKTVQKIYSEHPYNHSFIVNEKVLNLFRPLHLLRKT